MVTAGESYREEKGCLMHLTAIFPAWARILKGYRPFLSLEVTKECPLRCPGCYAYDPGHLNNGHSIRTLAELRGDELVQKATELVRQLRPLHVSLVGGEPLVRHREMTVLIDELEKLGIETQLVTSAVLPIPQEWKRFPNLHLVVSVDGLESEHNVRRAPATYDRILRNITGHKVIVHCTVVSQYLSDPGYLEEFAKVWSNNESAYRIWFSLFTPQKGQSLPERLSIQERAVAIDRIAALADRYPKVYATPVVIEAYRNPPRSPAACIFSQVTQCLSADLSTPVFPCQIGGEPECSECGCIAAAGFTAIGNFKLGGILKLSDIYKFSRSLGVRLKGSKRIVQAGNGRPAA
jgi:organic radical activating enzyme